MPDSRMNYDQLIEYAAGHMSPAEASRVEAYLRDHPDAARSVHLYRLSQASFAAGMAFEPTAEAIRRAHACFKAPPAEKKPSWLEVVDQFIARLLFDSRMQPAALRSTTAINRINWSYEFDAVEIDLQAERIVDATSQVIDDGEPIRWRMRGQLSGQAPFEAAQVALVTADSKDIVAETTAGMDGTFKLEMTAGRYDLYIQCAAGAMVITKLEIS